MKAQKCYFAFALSGK